jgi:hypothetical protein
MRTICDKLSDVYAKYYSVTEHVAVYKAIVLFKGRVIFKQYFPKKCKCFGIKIYNFDSLGFTYNMTMYLGKDSKLEAPTVTAAHTTVLGLMRRIEI